MKPIEIIAEARIRLGIGQQWFYEIRNAILIAAGLKVLFNWSIFISALVTIGVLILFFLTGLIDLNVIHLRQKEQELVTSKYNPHLNKLSKLVH